MAPITAANRRDAAIGTSLVLFRHHSERPPFLTVRGRSLHEPPDESPATLSPRSSPRRRGPRSKTRRSHEGLGSPPGNERGESGDDSGESKRRYFFCALLTYSTTNARSSGEAT